MPFEFLKTTHVVKKLLPNVFNEAATLFAAYVWDTANIRDASVTADKLAAGAVLQTVYTEKTTAVTSSTIIPYDNTIPQNTEGVEAMTLSITPKLASSDLVVEAGLHIRLSVAGVFVKVAALFRDSTVNAIASNAVFNDTVTTPVDTINLFKKASANATTATTFKVRFGPNVATTIYMNADTAGVGVFGGTCISWMKITEVKT